MVRGSLWRGRDLFNRKVERFWRLSWKALRRTCPGQTPWESAWTYTRTRCVKRLLVGLSGKPLLRGGRGLSMKQATPREPRTGERLQCVFYVQLLRDNRQRDREKRRERRWAAQRRGKAGERRPEGRSERR
ncbi:hypothetical protein TGGT1_359700 [Toxoplasma gondii GT1]|uniref:Uncharacterized protein n=1 Tax=Toxoplasma gondii (strain ATCC 50853 / GT1) TaxID=507601 RepID=S7VTR7_TOXGG|nr:hypothetical protein TGGT1_359700 [Toxoplasma gondii GT1]